MPILRRPAPSGVYCGTCQSTECSHAGGSGSSMPGLRRTLTVLAIAASATVLAPLGVANADPGTEWRGGYQGAGLVVQWREGGRECNGGPALYVVHTDDDTVANGAQRGDSAPGMGWVCVSEAAAGYRGWWPGRVNGPRG